MEALLLKVNRLMPEMLKEVHYPWGDAHICQESHAEANSSW